MGKLSAWGALAGAGEAVSQNAANRRQERLDTVAAAREERLLKMQMDHRSAEAAKTRSHVSNEADLTRDHQASMQQSAQGHASQESALGRSHQASMQEDSQDFAAGESSLTRDHQVTMQDDQQDFVSEENALDRAADMKVATVRARGASGGSRFKLSSIEETDSSSGFPVTTKVPVYFDEATQLFYKQVEGQRVPISTTAAPKPAVQALMSNPTEQLVQQFFNKYGYVPPELID